MKNIALNTLMFLVGFASCMLLIYTLLNPGLEKPLSSMFGGISAPGDWISDNNIKVTENSIVISIPNASLSAYAATGSMKPVLDAGANGIRIVPKNPEDIQVGDIVTYGNQNIVHRVIEAGKDEKGYWYTVKGDNNDFSDGTIRFEDIKYVTIGVLY